MKRLLKLLFIAFILQSISFAAVDVKVASFFPSNGGIYLGTNDNIVRIFSISGNATGLELSLGNNSSAVPFGPKGITKVELYRATTQAGLNTSTDRINSTTDGSEFSPYIFTINNTGEQYYAVKYSVARGAQYSYDSTYVGAYLSMTMKDGTEDVSISDPYSGQLIRILASGLIYLPNQLKSMLSSTTVIAANSIVPMLQFTLRAEQNTVNIESITLRSDNNFSTDGDRSGGKVVEIILLADNGNYMYDGVGRDVIVFQKTLPYNHNLPDEITLSFNQTIQLVPYERIGAQTNRHISERIFYVLYRLSSGAPLDDTRLSCRLGGGSGTLTIGGETFIPVDENGVGDAILTVRAADAHLVEIETRVGSDNDINALGGQRNVNMLKFAYDVKRRINNVSIEIYNEGSYRNKAADGVSLVYLYKDNGTSAPTLISVGEIAPTSTSTCIFRGITMEAGLNKYYVEYDIGVLVTADVRAIAQITAISAPGAGFSGYLPAPAAPSVVHLYPGQVWLDYVRAYETNGVPLTNITPGKSFIVELGVRNIIHGTTRPPSTPPRSFALRDTTRPVFLSSDIGFNTDTLGGQDISSQFDVTTNHGYNPPHMNPPYIGFDMLASDIAGNDPANPYRFLVTAKDNLRYTGTVYIDGQVVYDTGDYNSVIKPGAPSDVVYYTKYFDTGSPMRLRPAARNFINKTPDYAIVQSTGISSDTIKNSWKSYIEEISVHTKDGLYNKGFVRTQQIPAGAEMRIHLSPGFLIFPDVKINGEQKQVDIHYDYPLALLSSGATDNNVITIHGETIGNAPGVITLGGRVVDSEGVLSNAIETETIPYSIISSGQLNITNLYPYPSPYNPDTGDMTIGFNCNESGAKYSVHIYDATGREVFKETELSTELGYNKYLWDGSFSSGKKVGRGAYVLRVSFQGSKKQEIVTKFGVK